MVQRSIASGAALLSLLAAAAPAAAQASASGSVSVSGSASVNGGAPPPVVAPRAPQQGSVVVAPAAPQAQGAVVAPAAPQSQGAVVVAPAAPQSQGAVVVAPAAPPPVYAQPAAPPPVYAQPAVQTQTVYAQPPAVSGGVYVSGGSGAYMAGPAVVAPTHAPDTLRIRYGGEATIGYAAIAANLGAVGGFALGATGRLGVQINNSWAVYYQPAIVLGFVGGRTQSGATAGGVFIPFSNALMGEYTLADILHVGVGPSIDYVLGYAQSSTGEAIGANGWTVGANARIAVTIPGYTPWGRRGYSLGVDLHPTFTGNAVYFTALFGIGHEWY